MIYYFAPSNVKISSTVQGFIFTKYNPYDSKTYSWIEIAVMVSELMGLQTLMIDISNPTRIIDDLHDQFNSLKNSSWEEVKEIESQERVEKGIS